MNSVITLLRRAWNENRALAVTGLLMLATLACTLVGVVADPRVITGAPAWVKPAKFAVSITIYCYTFAWLLSYVEGRARLKRIAAGITVASMIIEMVCIVVQAARGTSSHFNTTTAFDSVIWTVMGAVIMIAFCATLLLAILMMMQRLPDRAFAWSLRLAVLVTLVGMAAAFLMTQPTAQQRAQRDGPHYSGAHSVGVADGGPGLPFVGWSTVGGDLRVPHFVGLHALQVLPFLGWLLTRRRLGEGQRTALVWIAGLGYLGLVVLLVWQALRGQSVIHPDSLTLTAAGALALTVLGAGAVTWIAGPRSAYSGRAVSSLV